MHLNFDIIKKHPYAAGIGAVFIFIVVYLLSKGSSGSSSSGAGDTQALASAEAQNSQQNAQLQLASLQAQVAVNNTNQSATVAEQQTAAQLNATNNSTAAQLAAIQTQSYAQIAGLQLNDTAQTAIDQASDLTSQNIAQIQANQNLGIATVGAQSTDYQVASNNATALGTVQANDAVLNNQLTEAAQVQEYGDNTQLQALENNNATAVSGAQIQAGYLNNVNSSQTAVALQTLADQTQIASQGQEDAYNITSGVLNTVNSGATNKGGQAGATTAGIIETILGASPASANGVAAANTVSSNNAIAGILSGITKGGSSLLTSLFA